jgi:anti-sigma factor RsiW
VTCREFADFIADYLTGDLPPATRAAFDQHLQACENCVVYLQNYRAVLRVGKLAFEDEQAPVPAEVPYDLVQAILEARKG